MPENEPEESADTAREIQSPFSKLEKDSPTFVDFSPQHHGLTVEDVVEELPFLQKEESSTVPEPVISSTSKIEPVIASPATLPPLPPRPTNAHAERVSTPPRG